MQETVVYLKKITQPEGEKKELERELSQCGWELFRMGMQEQYGLDGEKITIERNAHGKPYLPGHPQICFNISHSGEYAACAFASIPIGMDLQHFSALLPLQEGEDPETALTPALQATGQILYNYFSSQIYWAVGRAVPDILQISQSRQDALAAQQLLRSESPLAFYHEKPNTPLDHRAQVVAQVQQYIRAHLAEKLTLNDVAAVFNFSPNYLSQLFAQNSERGFVEYVTTARIAAAKELMAATDLKIYEVSSRVGFDSAFYFSKVFKKLEGASPREYIQRMKGSYVDAKDDAAL